MRYNLFLFFSLQIESVACLRRRWMRSRSRCATRRRTAQSCQSPICFDTGKTRRWCVMNVYAHAFFWILNVVFFFVFYWQVVFLSLKWTIVVCMHVLCIWVCMCMCACARPWEICVRMRAHIHYSFHSSCIINAGFLSLLFFCSKAIREMKLLAETFGPIKLVQARYNAAYT